MADLSLSGESPRSTGGPSPAIDIVEHSGRRLVVHIPPQPTSATRGLGVFALIWTTFSAVLFVFFAVAGFQGGAGKPSLFAALMPLLFVAIGAGMLYVWARMRHTRLFVLVDPDRVAVQRQFFQRKQETETAVDARTHAALVEAYSVNDVPVDAVAIQGGPKTLRFGVSLPPADKAWLVEQINVLICPPRAAEEPPACPQCGAPLPMVDNVVPEETTCPDCGHREVLRPVARRAVEIPELRPERGDPIPEEITVEEANPEELVFSVRLVSADGIRHAVGWIGFVIWLVMAAFAGPGLYRSVLALVAPPAPGAAGGAFPLLFTLFELVHGLLFLGGPPLVVFAVVRGRILVRLAREEFRIRWGAGLFRVSRRTPLEAIEDVRLVTAGKKGSNRQPKAGENHGAAAVIVKGIPWILTTFHAEPVALAAAGLVRTRLRDWGFLLTPAVQDEGLADQTATDDVEFAG